MNEKKNNGFAALILSLIVVVVAVLAVKFAGGTAAANAVKPGPGPEVTPGETQDATPAGKYGVGTYTSTSKGFGGDVTVTITIAEGDVIADVVIVGDGETPALGGVAMEKLAAKIKETQSVEVDAMSGATFTSQAVIAAAADCMAQAEAAAGSAPAGEGEAAGAYKPGTYTASSKGFGGDVVATVVIGEDGAIAEVSFVGASETAALGGVALEKLPAKFVDAQSAEVDAMTGATFTSNAAIAAVADCLAQAAN